MVPTVKVVAESSAAANPAASTSASAHAILSARTELQRFRTETGAKAFPVLAMADQTLTMRPEKANDTTLVRDWEKNRPLPPNELGKSGDVFGISSLPYKNANELQQPGGRDWRRLHNDQVRYGGGWLIFGIVLALALFLFGRGRIKVVDGFSGETVERFNVIERSNHWMTVCAFMIMAFTGIILLYGKPFLIPIVGEGAFGSIASGSAWLHMASAVPFVLGIVVMVVLWLKDNLPNRLDWKWLKRGGGFLHDDGHNPPALKFNAGQKLVFWGVIFFGFALLATGVTLMFPFMWFGYDGMQWAQISHAVIALLMIALIIGHIYIGTIGMQGAIDAMWGGQVDVNWAKEHHSIWLRRILHRSDRAVE